MRGGPAGDLYIFLSLGAHAFFQRDGADLHCRVPISMVQAALGGEFEVPTIDGGKTRVKVPEGTQSGRRFRLQGKGMPVLRSRQVGDMYVQVVVETPQKLTKKQRELLAEFERLSSQDTHPESDGILRQGQGSAQPGRLGDQATWPLDRRGHQPYRFAGNGNEFSGCRPPCRCAPWKTLERQIERQLRFIELKRGAIGRRIGWRLRDFEQKNLNRDEFRFFRSLDREAADGRRGGAVRQGAGARDGGLCRSGRRRARSSSSAPAPAR